MTHEYLLAESMRLAFDVARVEWGWRRIGNHEVSRPDGRYFHKVWVVSDGKRIRGTPRGTIVHLGVRWYNAPHSEVIRDMIGAGMLVLGRVHGDPEQALTPRSVSEMSTSVQR